MSKTPETDKALLAVQRGTDAYSFPEHARKMEEQRNELRSKLAAVYSILARRDVAYGDEVEGRILTAASVAVSANASKPAMTADQLILFLVWARQECSYWRAQSERAGDDAEYRERCVKKVDMLESAIKKVCE